MSTAMATYPKPDYCGECYVALTAAGTFTPGSMVPTLPNGETPALPSAAPAWHTPTTPTGYVATYRCDSGHTWSTYWDSDQRITLHELMEHRRQAGASR